MDNISKAKMKNRISIRSILKDIIPDISFDKDFHIIIAIVIGILTFAFILYKVFRSKSKRDIVAFLGLCESGKTHLLSQLCYETETLTVTSSKESSAFYTLQNNKKVKILDVPGHDRIRYSAFNKVKNQCKAIVFVIDAATIQRDIRDVAEFLYNLFSDNSVQTGRPSILIACNKQDLMTAKGVRIIKSSLEKEMNLVRVTKANQLESVGEEGSQISYLGMKGEDFEFSHLKPLNVSFVECIAKQGNQIQELKDWIEAVA